MNARRQRAFVIFMTIAGAAFITAVFIFLFVPALTDVRTLADDIIDAQAELEAQYANRKNLLQSLEDVERIRQTTQDLKGQFITPGEELVFITRIEETAAAAGVESTIRLSGSTTSKGKPTGINDAFDIGLVGTYPDVLNAIRSIERLPNITVINAVSIRAGDLAAGEATSISASVKGRIAFTPEGL